MIGPLTFCELSDRLVAIGIAGGREFMHDRVVKPGFSQPRLIRKEGVNQLNQTPFVLP